MRTTLALILSAMLVSGCSSTQTAQAGAHDPVKMPKAGPALSTEWGVLPSYKQPTVLNFKNPNSICP